MSARRTPQGVNSSTFHPPPLDHDFSIPELYRHHSLKSPTHTVFMYSDLDAGTTTFINYREAWSSICKSAAIVSRNLFKSHSSAPSRPAVIAVMAASDTLSYIYLLIAIMSLGYTAFPMSPRNNAEATANLLKTTGAAYIFTNNDGPNHTLVNDARALLSKDGLSLDILPMPQYKDLMNMSDVKAMELPQIHNDDTMLILHSSGTTAFPKPIWTTKKALINLSNIPCYGELDLTNKRVAVHTNPAFHAMGSGTYLVRFGAIFAVYNPLKPVIPTPANFLASWVADKCDIVFCVPIFLEAWAPDPKNVAKLRALDSVLFGGASVNKSIGDMLTQEGVVMHPFWGSTEIGPATMFVPRDPPPPDQWDYFRISNHITFYMKPREGLENVFEPILIPTETCFPHAPLNTFYDDKPAFNVGDLLERHPTNPERWRVYGRQDDQIMLSLGENVNPLPIEHIISQDKHIAAAVVFGSHRPHAGVLVQPIPEPDGKTELDEEQLEYLRTLIWPSVEKANSTVPPYARIQKNMILTTSSRKPLEYTTKGTPRRPVALRIYAAEIDVLYHEEQGSIFGRPFPDRA
ncbi:acetyl-CoA synthetase-like protein [Mycena filopes]|nr:acetyl-CoA synthetase-like protein [Mycena filopes]